MSLIAISLKLFGSVWRVAHDVKRVSSKVKANAAQSRTLNDRIQNMLPHLQALQMREEERQKQVTTQGYVLSPAEVQQIQAMQKQLSFFLSTLEDACTLLRSFEETDWVSRIAKRANHAQQFEEINASLSQAMQDLHFAVNVNSIFDQKKDLDDAANDLDDIKVRQEEILDTLHVMDERAQVNAESSQEFQMARFQSQKKMMMNLERNFAKLAMLQQKQMSSNSSTKSDTTSAVSPKSPHDEFLQIPITDLKLDAKPVGSGGFGDCYRALWISRDEIVAVKKLRVEHMSESVRADFFAELTFLKTLPHHHHIVALHGVCIDEQSKMFCMVMDWMENGSLYAYLRKHPVLPYRRQLHMAMQCAKAINHLHLLRPPVLHRDIKSMNFLLDAHHDIKVCDFGLAVVRAESMTQSKLVASIADSAGGAGGTLQYNAPELLDGFAEYSQACDVYSLAIVFWEIATSKIPYENVSSDRIAVMVPAGKRLPIPANVHPGLKALIEEGWHQDPEARPSCQEIITKLKELIHEEQQSEAAKNASTAEGQEPGGPSSNFSSGVSTTTSSNFSSTTSFGSSVSVTSESSIQYSSSTSEPAHGGRIMPAMPARRELPQHAPKEHAPLPEMNPKLAPVLAHTGPRAFGSSESVKDAIWNAENPLALAQTMIYAASFAAADKREHQLNATNAQPGSASASVSVSVSNKNALLETQPVPSTHAPHGMKVAQPVVLAAPTPSPLAPVPPVAFSSTAVLQQAAFAPPSTNSLQSPTSTVSSPMPMPMMVAPTPVVSPPPIVSVEPSVPMAPITQLALNRLTHFPGLHPRGMAFTSQSDVILALGPLAGTGANMIQFLNVMAPQQPFRGFGRKGRGAGEFCFGPDVGSTHLVWDGFKNILLVFTIFVDDAPGSTAGASAGANLLKFISDKVNVKQAGSLERKSRLQLFYPNGQLIREIQPERILSLTKATSAFSTNVVCFTVDIIAGLIYFAKEKETVIHLLSYDDKSVVKPFGQDLTSLARDSRVKITPPGCFNAGGITAMVFDETCGQLYVLDSISQMVHVCNAKQNWLFNFPCKPINGAGGSNQTTSGLPDLRGMWLVPNKIQAQQPPPPLVPPQLQPQGSFQSPPPPPFMASPPPPPPSPARLLVIYSPSAHLLSFYSTIDGQLMYQTPFHHVDCLTADPNANALFIYGRQHIQQQGPDEVAVFSATPIPPPSLMNTPISIIY